MTIFAISDVVLRSTSDSETSEPNKLKETTTISNIVLEACHEERPHKTSYQETLCVCVRVLYISSVANAGKT